MGRLIDEDILIDSIPDLSVFEQEDFGTPDMIRLIEDAPTVEAIPKDQYENRLKADMVAMLTEIQIEFDEKYWRDTQGYIIKRNGFNSGIEICVDIIQEKINALKENTDGKNID